MNDSFAPLQPLPVPLPLYARRALKQSAFAARLKSCFAGRESVHAVAMYDEHGETLPLLASLLSPKQTWDFYNRDRAQTMLAVGQLAEWADRAVMEQGRIVLEKGAQELAVALKHEAGVTATSPVDLWVLGGGAQAVPTKTLLGIVRQAIKAKAVLVLCNPWPVALGWDEAHPEDGAVFSAWSAVSRRSSSMAHADALAALLQDNGYTVEQTAGSLTVPDQEAQRQLVELVADPLRSRSAVPYLLLQDWTGQRRQGCDGQVCYSYFLAMPAE